MALVGLTNRNIRSARIRNGEAQKRITPGDPLDDVADDARYGIYTFVTSSPKPRELVMREQLKDLAEQGDLTSALIRHQQMLEEETAKYAPARLGRYRPTRRR